MDELDTFNYVVALENDFHADPTRMPPVGFVLAEGTGHGQARPLLLPLPDVEDVRDGDGVVALLEHHIHHADAVAAGLAMTPAIFAFVGVQLAVQSTRFDLHGSGDGDTQQLSTVAIGHRNGNLYAAHRDLCTAAVSTRRYVRDDLNLKIARRTLGLAQILAQALGESTQNGPSA